MQGRRIVDGKDVVWVVDFTAAIDVVYAYAFALTMLQQTNVVQKKLTNMPWRTVADVQVSPSTVRANAALLFDDLYQGWKARVSEDGEAALVDIVRYRQKTFDLRRQVSSIYVMADGHNTSTIGAADAAVQWAQWTRDTSLSALAVCAGVAGGGIAYAVGGACAVAQGGAKYQDTGNLGAAAITTVGGLVMLGCGGLTNIPGLDKTSKGIIIGFGFIMDGAFETGGQLVEGKSGQQALAAAATKGIIGLITLGLGSRLSGQFEAVEKQVRNDKQLAEAMGKVQSFCEGSLDMSGKMTEKKTVDMSVAATAPKKNSLPKIAPSTAHALQGVGAGADTLQFIRNRVLHRAH